MSKVAVVGLGYVGLPLAVAFGRVIATIGVDLSSEKIAAYETGVDPTGEMTPDEFAAATRLSFTTDFAGMKDADFIVVAVPTPVDATKRPDLDALRKASASVGACMKRGTIVIFESTVYPGATEEICVPALEAASGLKRGIDFNVGYSPERINPGDHAHRLENIVKVVAGDNEETLRKVAELYSKIVTAGVHRVSSIRVAEAAKVIENTQRDLNIALMNELSIIFDREGLDTAEVLEAAGTKWNFLRFRPGLVGGHCIGVDPYYLTHKAEALGYHPQVILAGRRINDSMGAFVAERTVKCLVETGSPVRGARVNLLGVTFKEDVADIRNSKVFDVIKELQTFGVELAIHDPMIKAADTKGVLPDGLRLCGWEDLPEADAMIVAVGHRAFLERPLDDFVEKIRAGGAFIDVQSRFDREALLAAGLRVWRL